jgi:hypothetical protein
MVFMGLFLFQVAKRMFFQNRPVIALDYPMKYADFENECPFTFEMN